MSKKKQTPKKPKVQPNAEPKKYNWMMERLMKEDWWVKGLRKVEPTKDTYQVSFIPEIPPKEEEKKKTEEWQPNWDDIERLADLFRNHR